MDSGLLSLRLAARYLGIFADLAKVEPTAPHYHPPAGTTNLDGAARTLGLNVRRVATNWSGLRSAPLPAIAHLRDGSFLVVARFTEDKVLVQHPMQGRPQLLDATEFAQIWDGDLILVRRQTWRARLARLLGLRWLSARPTHSDL